MSRDSVLARKTGTVKADRTRIRILDAAEHYFSERGYKQDAEFEYVFGERSRGELFVAGLKDAQGGKREAAPEDRWAVLWNHDQELPARWRWQTDLNLSSDNLYSDDFNEMRDFRSFRFLVHRFLLPLVLTSYLDAIETSLNRDSSNASRFRWAGASSSATQSIIQRGFSDSSSIKRCRAIPNCCSSEILSRTRDRTKASSFSK